MSVQLAVSLVVYGFDEAVLSNTLMSLGRAIRVAQQEGWPRINNPAAKDPATTDLAPINQSTEDQSTEKLGTVHITLVDNADHADELEPLLRRCFESAGDAVEVDVISGHGNIGFGQAHNLVIHRVEGEYYLILNPDVILDDRALSNGIHHLQQTPTAVAVSPAIVDGNGEPESGCKRYPSVLDFSLRGFAPSWLKQRFRQRLRHYEMRDLPLDQTYADVPIISGCFMLFRHDALRQLGGFDPHYFLYFEDFDLSIRARSVGKLSYLPQMRITHLGGNSAKKGVRHILMFGRSAYRFFSSHGWRWL